MARSSPIGSSGSSARCDDHLLLPPGSLHKGRPADGPPVHDLIDVRYGVPVESANGVGGAGRHPIGLLLRQVAGDLRQEIKCEAYRILRQFPGGHSLFLFSTYLARRRFSGNRVALARLSRYQG
jgi:hypothetical protein